jgi:BirA family transcriptional regulator, biotin operon repressor / biotin---[acetyl-CoA-carboxylase] ligase
MAAPRADALSFGQPLHFYERLASTQAVARELASEGAPEGATIVAIEQTGGRGRLGNTFLSPPGGLYLSLILRPSLQPSEAPLIGLALGLAVAESIQALTHLEPVLKWPNDVLLGRRKVSGVLVDLSTSGDGIRWAIAGVGVNVNAQSFPGDLRATATSLSLELGHDIGLDALRTEVLQRFEARYLELLAKGPPALLAAWSSAPNLLGQTVHVSAGPQAYEGTAQGLDKDGALLVRLQSGELRRVVAADVHLLPTLRPD